MNIKKIVVIGPESTGKSTLCKQLAAHYQTLWVPEYAREFLITHGTKYSYDDLLLIAKGQVALEEEAVSRQQSAISRQQSAISSQQSAVGSGQKEVSSEQKVVSNIVHPTSNIVHRTSNIPHQTSSISPSGARGLLFIDTDMYVMKVWCEFVFNRCHNWILNQIATRKYDAYLLCDVDLPWVKDELREYPDKKTREKLYFFYKDLMVNQSTPWCNISGDYEQRFDKAIHFIDNLK